MRIIRTTLLALAAGIALPGVALAQAYLVPPPAMSLDREEVRDRERDRLERIQERERRALRAEQRDELRVRGLDDEDDDDDE